MLNNTCDQENSNTSFCSVLYADINHTYDQMKKKYFILFGHLWRCKYDLFISRVFDPKLDYSEQCQQENQYQSQHKYLTSETF